MTADSSYIIDDSLRISYYKAIERPRSIENEHYKADFYYDGNGDRYMMKVYERHHEGDSLIFTRYYMDAKAEVTTDTLGHYSHLYYAGGDAYTAPAVMVIDESGNTCIYQICRDNLGSAIEYANANGVRYQYSYSPWGVRLQQVGDSIVFCQPGEFPSNCPFYRTYTGHEELWMFGLLNANARLYSPYLGRFVSPDPLLNEDGRPLDFNPYIYARNNPYRYIDRNGEFWWFVAAAVFGGFGNVLANFDNINNAGGFFKSFGIGAGAGALGGWLGPSIAVGLGFGATGAISGAFTGAITGLTSSVTEGLMNAAFLGSKFSFTNCLMQTTLSAVAGGIIGGIDAVCHKKTFFHGYYKSRDVIKRGYQPLGQGEDAADCVGRCCESLTNGEVSHEAVREYYNGVAKKNTNPRTDQMHDLTCYKYTANTVGRHAEVGINNPHLMYEQMACGDDFGVTYAVSGVDGFGNSVSGNHNVLITKASRTIWIKPNGTFIMRKPKLWVMDPAGGGSIHRIYKKQLENVIRVY